MMKLYEANSLEDTDTELVMYYSPCRIYRGFTSLCQVDA